MAKATTRPKTASKTDRTRTRPDRGAHRVNTHKGNGSASTSTEVAPPGRRRPRSQPLPGLEDRAIQPLEAVAAAYADVRDRRIDLNREEAELKATALSLMKKFDKQLYRHDGIEIRVVPGEEDVKVKVKKAGDDDQADPETGEDVAIESAPAEAVG